jgi:ABC-type sugar transport system permease subunit
VGYGSAIATLMTAVIVVVAAIFMNVQARRDLAEEN